MKNCLKSIHIISNVIWMSIHSSVKQFGGAGGPPGEVQRPFGWVGGAEDPPEGCPRIFRVGWGLLRTPPWIHHFSLDLLRNTNVSVIYHGFLLVTNIETEALCLPWFVEKSVSLCMMGICMCVQPIASCAMPVMKGMRVKTDSPMSHKAR